MVPALHNFDNNKRYKVKQGKLKVPVTLVRNDGIIYPTGMLFSFQMPTEEASSHCPRLPIQTTTGSPTTSGTSGQHPFSPPTGNPQQLAIRAPQVPPPQVVATSSAVDRFPPTPASDLENLGNSPLEVRSPAEMVAGPMRGQMRGIFPPPRHHPYPLPPPQQMRPDIFQGNSPQMRPDIFRMRALQQQDQGVFPQTRIAQLPPIPQVAQDLRMHRGNPENPPIHG